MASGPEGRYLIGEGGLTLAEILAVLDGMQQSLDAASVLLVAEQVRKQLQVPGV
jgi:hypothetical protein